MAYTYDEFVNAAKNAGMYDSFGQEDLTMAQSKPEYGLSLLKLRQDAGKATTEEQKLLVQEAVNQLRSSYGVTLPNMTNRFLTNTAAGTGTGTEQAVSAPGGYSYGRENDYQKLLAGASAPSSFDFDHRTDETYGAMKDAWTADGDRTSGNVLRAPVVSGGTQAGWAQNAAQQSNNYYDAKLADQIPTIYQNAYDEYRGGQEQELSKLGALGADREFDYAKYLQQVQMDQAAAQQQFENDMTLHKTFGTRAPTMPDLDNLTPGENTTYTYGQQNAYDDALNAVLNQEKFGYDHAEDPLYAALRKSSLREGDRAAADAMAELSARTGGVASSYGVRAAADAGNEHNEGLNASIPGLRKTAYQEYLGEFDGKLQDLGTLADDRAFDYASWLQQYQLDEEAKQKEFENALALYKKIGLTPEIAAILGVPYVKPSSGGNGSPNPKDGDLNGAIDYLNALVAGQYPDGSKSSTGGYDRGTQTGQGAVGSTINKEINAAQKAGAINKAQADALREVYSGRGSGGRYTY